MRTGIKSGMTNSGMSKLLFLEPRLTADPKAPIKLSTGVPRKRENIRFSHVSKDICKNIANIGDAIINGNAVVTQCAVIFAITTNSRGKSEIHMRSRFPSSKSF
tara:strand:+ start:193 stop:504 length:312 start_codon:yes stop_codon:yes gene_type:complete